MLDKILFIAKKILEENKYALKTIIYNNNWVLMHDGIIESNETNIWYFNINNNDNDNLQKFTIKCLDGIIIIHENYIISISQYGIEIINMSNNKATHKTEGNFIIDECKGYFSKNNVIFYLYDGIMEGDIDYKTGLYYLNLKKDNVSFYHDDVFVEVLDECILQFNLEEKKLQCYNKKLLCEMNNFYNNFDELKDIIQKNYKAE